MNVVFDFDGVIHSFTSGFTSVDQIPDPPVPGIKEAIAEIREAGFSVIVVSSRCRDTAGWQAIGRWLKNEGIEVDGILATKPPAICYIDDRAICFDGDASSLLDKILDFKPWNR